MNDYNSVLASLKVEGLEPSDEAKKWSKMYLEGTLTSDQVIKRIINKYRKGVKYESISR